MADNNKNHRMTKSETEHFIEQLKKPQDWTKQTSDKKQLSIPRVSQRSELLAFAKEMQRIGFNEYEYEKLQQTNLNFPPQTEYYNN